MSEQNKDFSLYNVFGKFMGKNLSPNPSDPLYIQQKNIKNITNEIREKAEDNNLKPRFISGSRPTDIDSNNPETQNRVNIIARPNPQGQQRIVEISIG